MLKTVLLIVLCTVVGWTTVDAARNKGNKHICRLPPVVGPCEALIPRWYYNTKEGQCLQFTYGGCEGNKNNFETQLQCDEACRPCDNPVQYLVDPCEHAQCEARPDAICVANYCGGCNAVFYDSDGTAVDCSCDNPVNCFIDPCQVAPECAAYPYATCRANYCVGCDAYFYEPEGVVVDCDCNLVHCFADPCDGATCSVPGARCVANYCGGCNAYWYDADNNRVDC